MKLKLSALCLAAVLGSFYAPNSMADEQQNLDVFYYSLNDPFIASYKEELEAAAKDLNIKLDTFDANNDAGTQELQIGYTLDNGRAKLVNVVYPLLTDQVIEDCKKNNARLVFFNRQPDLTMLNGYDKAWFVEGDSMQAGQLQAELIDEYVKKHPQIDRNHDGKISTVILKGDPNHQATYLRTANVINTLATKVDNIEVAGELNGNFSQQDARGELETFVVREGLDKVELVICNNDAMALGAISVLNNEGYNTGDKSYKYIPVFGIDALDTALEAIADGKMEGTVLNDTKAQARAVLKLALSKETDKDALSKELGLKVGSTGMVYVPYAKITK